MLWFVQFLIYITACFYSFTAAMTQFTHKHQSRLILPHAVALRCFVCVCVCAGVLRPGFMHERACILDWAEEIPEIMQLIPLSCCFSEQIKMFRTVSLGRVFDFSAFPRWPIASSSTNPWSQVLSASAGRQDIYWFTISITALTRTAESGRDLFGISVNYQLTFSPRREESERILFSFN